MSDRRITTQECSEMLAAADAREMLREYPEFAYAGDRVTLVAEALMKVASQPHSQYATFAFVYELVKALDKGLDVEILEDDPDYAPENGARK